MPFPDSGQVLCFAQKWSVGLMFYDRFRFLCDQKGVSCNKAATDMGLSNSTPTKWKKTGATPDSKTLSLVSEYFGVSISYLLTGEQKEKAPATDGERKKKLRSVARLESADITPELDKNIADYIDYLLSKRDRGE